MVSHCRETVRSFGKCTYLLWGVHFCHRLFLFNFALKKAKDTLLWRITIHTTYNHTNKIIHSFTRLVFHNILRRHHGEAELECSTIVDCWEGGRVYSTLFAGHSTDSFQHFSKHCFFLKMFYNLTTVLWNENVLERKKIFVHLPGT